MENSLQYEIHSKEKFYFTIKLIAALIGYILLIYGFKFAIAYGKPEMLFVLFFYGGMIVFYLILRMGLMIGYIKGNAVKITERQFPEVHAIVVSQSAALGLKKTPDVYLLQSGGMLNAFATKFIGRNYVVIYSEVFEEAYANNVEAVEFIIGHELGHVKRNHVTKALILFPAFIIPFLGAAYSRGCEYTCDNIGAALNPKGAHPGLMILASGKNLWRKVNYERFIAQENTEDGFWFWFAEKVSSHPRLTKRLGRFRSLAIAPASQSQAAPIKKEVADHSSYMPR